MSMKPTTLLATGVVVAFAVVPVAANPAYAVATCDGRPATIVGTPGDDQIEGTAGPDVIATGRGNDHVIAGGGRDVICLGAGADFAEGGEGNDYVRAGAGDDYLSSAVGFDRLVGNRGHDVLFVASPAGARSYGGPGRDAISLSIAPDARVDVAGGPGWDQIGFGVGGSALDITIDQRAGTVDVAGRGGAFRGFAYVSLTGDHRWTYRGTGEEDLVSTVDGTVTATLRGGDDKVWAGDGDDFLDGGPGHDFAGASGGVNHCISIEDTDGAVCNPPPD